LRDALLDLPHLSRRQGAIILRIPRQNPDGELMQRLVDSLGFIHAQLSRQAFCGLAAYTRCAINGTVAKCDLIVLTAGGHGNSSFTLDILKISKCCVIVNPCVRPAPTELNLAALDAAVTRVRRRGIRDGEPGPQNRYESGPARVLLGCGPK
jgi:hypothetical protein